MNSTSPKTQTEGLRPLDMDQLLTHQLHYEQEDRRQRKIARIGRLWDHRKLLFKFALIGAAVSLLIAFLIPSDYTSTTRLMPPDSPSGQGMALLAGIAGKMGGLLSGIDGDLLGMTASAELFAGVLQSDTMENNLIEKFDLRHVYSVKRLVDARKKLKRQTDISVDRKSGILTIEVTDHDPSRAKAMADEYVAQLNGIVVQLNTSAAHRERVFLEDRLVQVKNDLEASEKDFSRFASKSGAIDIKEQGKAMVESAAMLEGQLIAAQTELQGLRQIFTDENIRVQTLQARIGELRRQLEKMGGKPDAEQADTSKEDELYPSIRKLPVLGVTYADLYRRMQVEETVFQTLTQQYEIAKVQEAKEVPSVKVLDAAEIPEKKVFPPRALLTLLGAMLALAIGAAWVIGSDLWTTIDSQDPGKILVLHMVRSVSPQLEYIVQTRNSIASHARNSLKRFRSDAPSPERESYGQESVPNIRRNASEAD
jgi:capsule polysaccharide export protein KpsE/RkpR